MSLTSFIQRSDVKTKFRQEFQKPSFSVKKELLAAPRTKHYSLIGTAFDYLFRFYMRYLNPNTIDKGYWVAELALIHLLHNSSLYTTAETIISQAKQRVSTFLQTGQINDDLIESALLLAGLDPIFRAKRGYDYIGQIDFEDVKDLGNLISFVPWEQFKADKLCLVNPTFGEASRLVGGADADIVVDDTIIEIKTVQRLQLERKTFDQLMGNTVRIEPVDAQ